MSTSLMNWSEKLGRTQPRILTFVFDITGAKAISEKVPGNPVLTAFDALSAQSDIDDFLGTSGEFNLAAFDATALGVDAFGMIVDMKEQCDTILSAEIKTLSGANLDTIAEAGASGGALSDSTLEPGALVGANGNIAVRFVSSGLDALASGLLMVKIAWLPK